MTFDFTNELNKIIKELKHENIQKMNDIRFNGIDSTNRIDNIIEMGNTLVLKELNKENDLNINNFYYIQNALVYTLSLSLIISSSYKDNYSKFKNAWNAKLDCVEKLLRLKNADYGSSYMNVANKLGVCNTFAVRILDKCNRLEQLQQTHDLHVHNETSLDTVNDLIGYYILFLLALKEKQQKNK